MPKDCPVGSFLIERVLKRFRILRELKIKKLLVSLARSKSIVCPPQRDFKMNNSEFIKKLAQKELIFFFISSCGVYLPSPEEFNEILIDRLDALGPLNERQECDKNHLYRDMLSTYEVTYSDPMASEDLIKALEEYAIFNSTFSELKKKSKKRSKIKNIPQHELPDLVFVLKQESGIYTFKKPLTEKQLRDRLGLSLYKAPNLKVIGCIDAEMERERLLRVDKKSGKKYVSAEIAKGKYEATFPEKAFEKDITGFNTGSEYEMALNIKYYLAINLDVYIPYREQYNTQKRQERSEKRKVEHKTHAKRSDIKYYKLITGESISVYQYMEKHNCNRNKAIREINKLKEK